MAVPAALAAVLALDQLRRAILGGREAVAPAADSTAEDLRDFRLRALFGAVADALDPAVVPMLLGLDVSTLIAFMRCGRAGGGLVSTVLLLSANFAALASWTW